ncbi:MAG: hypothetical protein ACPGYV_04280 [Phycisphaeraceae bacterium]
MRSLIGFSVWIGLLLVSGTDDACAQSPVSDQDQTVYDTLYSEKLASVRRTRSTADDSTLVVEMMAFANEIPDDKGVQCLIYIDAIPLAAAGSDIEMMRSAVVRLEAMWPGHPAIESETLIDLGNRAFRAASRSDREAVGESLLNLLLSLADRAEAKGAVDEAVSICRQANTIARSVDSPLRDSIEDRLDRLAIESAVNSRIEMLALSVRKNPQNAPAARELVDLLVTKRNDPVGAAQYVQSTRDADLIDVLGFAAKGVEKASAAEAMRVADWYLALAEDLDDPFAEPLLERSRKWYERFFALYTRQDALAKRVAAMDEVANKKLIQIDAARSDEPTDGWIDLIADAVDLDRHVIKGKAMIEDGDLGMGVDTVVVMPADTDGSYEFKVTLSVFDPDDDERLCFAVTLPVHDRYIRLYYSWTGDRAAWAKNADIDAYLINNRNNILGKQVPLTYQVAMNDDGSAEVVMLISDARALYWQGDADSLSTAEDFELPEGTEEMIRTYTRHNTVLYDARFRRQDK